MTGLLVRAIAGLLARLPLPLNHAIGASLGWLAWLFPTELRRITRINLELCFPEQSVEWRERVGRTSLIETGKALTEAPWLWRAGPERLRDLLDPGDVFTLIDKVVATNRNAIFTTLHLGSWEYLGLVLATRYPLTSLYRPPRQQFLEPLIRRGRESTGARLVPTNRHGIREILTALENGRFICVLPDQEPKAGTGVFAPFFGLPAYTMTLLPKLARRQHRPVIVLYAERLPMGRGFRLHARNIGDNIHDGEDTVAVAKMNAAVETLVCENPRQYMWSYKRFSTRPEGVTSPYQRR